MITPLVEAGVCSVQKLWCQYVHLAAGVDVLLEHVARLEALVGVVLENGE